MLNPLSIACEKTIAYNGLLAIARTKAWKKDHLKFNQPKQFFGGFLCLNLWVIPIFVLFLIFILQGGW